MLRWLKMSTWAGPYAGPRMEQQRVMHFVGSSQESRLHTLTSTVEKHVSATGPSSKVRGQRRYTCNGRLTRKDIGVSARPCGKAGSRRGRHRIACTGGGHPGRRLPGLPRGAGKGLGAEGRRPKGVVAAQLGLLRGRLCSRLRGWLLGRPAVLVMLWEGGLKGRRRLGSVTSRALRAAPYGGWLQAQHACQKLE